MRIITEPRPQDRLEDFGTLLRFKALVYEGDGNRMDFDCRSGRGAQDLAGTVAFHDTRKAAGVAFDTAVRGLRRHESAFVEEGVEEGFVALFENEKGLMLVAADTLMGFRDDLNKTAPARIIENMRRITWQDITEKAR
jgi:hypothetical protein